jgi:hypothetical protein
MLRGMKMTYPTRGSRRTNNYNLLKLVPTKPIETIIPTDNNLTTKPIETIIPTENNLVTKPIETIIPTENNLVTKPIEKKKYLTVLLFHNDEDLVESQINYYLKNNQELIVFLHNCSDNSENIVNNYKNSILCIYKLSNKFKFFKNEVHTFIYDILLGKQLNFDNNTDISISEIKYIDFNFSKNYNWISFPESDEFLEGPDRSLTFYEHLEKIHLNKNINKIEYLNVVFWFTEMDNMNIKDIEKRIKYYSFKKNCAPRIYSWRGNKTIQRLYGHMMPLDKRTEIVKWHTRHYEMRSKKQFHNKLLNRIKSRIIEESNNYSNYHYNYMLHKIIEDDEYGCIKSTELHFDDGNSNLIMDDKYDWNIIYCSNVFLDDHREKNSKIFDLSNNILTLPFIMEMEDKLNNLVNDEEIINTNNTKINYVIATYNGKNKRKDINPCPGDILKLHIEYILKYKSTNINQITIMAAESENYYKDYYNINELREKSDIPIIIQNCENYGFSPGQWLYAYEIYKNQFDYYFFIEDDYCGNMMNFDEIYLNSYKHNCTDNEGILSSIYEKNLDFFNKPDLPKSPIHFEGCIFTSSKTLDKLYRNPYYQLTTPRQSLDRITNKTHSFYSWCELKNIYTGAYYQITMSQLFSDINIKHYSLTEVSNNKFPLCYWSDGREVITKIIFDYTNNKHIYLNNVFNCYEDLINYPIAPIQTTTKNLFNKNIIK